VLDVFGYGLLAGVVLLVPRFSDLDCPRKVRGTLALLFNTPNPWSNYFGKLFAILGLVAILLAMTVPAAAACYALGGVSLTREIGPLYLVLFLAALQLSALALLVSSCANSSDSALRLTYGLVVILTVAVLGPYALLKGGEGVPTVLASWARCLSPIPAVMEVLGHGDVGLQGFTTDFSATARYVLLAALGSLGLMLATVTRLSDRLLDRSRPAGVVTEERPATERLWRRLVFLIDPQRRSDTSVAGPTPSW
jgi:hypothetical protein